MRRDVYSGFMKLHGEEHADTLDTANNYAWSLYQSKRLKKPRPLLRKTLPVARRVIGDNSDLTLTMRWNYARALGDPDATLGDIREAVDSRGGRRTDSGAC